ncbi:hypothetical protein [Paraglaciecola hydrolytica]|uniref:Uncharacterized protein n=1 Tax=Paraglaciecola hydrolytica TaxID=1799789 RepID=A0A148KN30_9ALTE|nr:hypothetical protein [Paraglaciecola hydrolytica]KXI27691.1 hypothetical protein AX660_19250 [Paraglaciecola hydrolytica]
MKLKICLLLLLLGCGSSLLVFSEPVTPQDPDKTLPTQLIKLKKAIETASYNPDERNSMLRYQRALLYYVSAKQRLQLNWRKQAIEDAQRGLKLLEMNELSEQNQTEQNVLSVS